MGESPSKGILRQGDLSRDLASRATLRGPVLPERAFSPRRLNEENISPTYAMTIASKLIRTQMASVDVRLPALQ
jgi:hypothetical protein